MSMQAQGIWVTIPAVFVGVKLSHTEFMYKPLLLFAGNHTA